MIFPVDKTSIQKVIPHREPFLFVDEIVSMEGGKVTAHFTFLPSDPVFKGHFPGEPVVPGVLQIEALAQTGAYSLLSLPENKGKNAYLLKVSDAKFKRVVKPGERLDLTVEKTRSVMNMSECRAEARVNGELAVECILMCALV